MAYEPALASFILAGTVGGLAMVMSLSADWEATHELSRATQGWTSVMVSRTYDEGDAKAQRRAAQEAAILLAHGYEPMPEPGDPAAADRTTLEPGDGAGPAAPAPRRRIVRYRLAAIPS